MQQNTGVVGVEVTYYEKASVIFDCVSEAEAREALASIEQAMSTGQSDIELDNRVSIGLENVRSVDMITKR